MCTANGKIQGSGERDKNKGILQGRLGLVFLCGGVIFALQTVKLFHRLGPSSKDRPCAEGKRRNQTVSDGLDNPAAAGDRPV